MKNKTEYTRFIHVHSIKAIEDRHWLGITYLVKNIPIAKEAAVLELFSEKCRYYIEYAENKL